MGVKKNFFSIFIAAIFLITAFILASYFFALTFKYLLAGNLLAILVAIGMTLSVSYVLSKKYNFTISKIKYVLYPFTAFLLSYGLEKYISYFSYLIFLFSLTYLFLVIVENNNMAIHFLEYLEVLSRKHSSFNIVQLTELGIPAVLRKNKFTYSMYFIFQIENSEYINHIKEIASTFTSSNNVSLYVFSILIEDDTSPIWYLAISINLISYKKISERISEYLFPILNSIISDNSKISMVTDITDIQALIPYLMAISERHKLYREEVNIKEEFFVAERGLVLLLFPNNGKKRKLLEEKKKILNELRKIFGNSITDYALWTILLKSSYDDFPELTEYKRAFENLRKLEREGFWDFKILELLRKVSREHIWAVFPDFCLKNSCTIAVKNKAKGHATPLSDCLNVFSNHINKMLVKPPYSHVT
ncbi:MAG: hypothetical protein ACP6IS_04135 [Candidatus Asgardarchaeia archaeon]